MSGSVASPTSVVGRRHVPVWASLLALALGGFAIGTTEFATMGVLPDIAGSLGVTIPQAGWAITAYALGVVIGAPLFAVLGARVTRKRLLLGLMAAFTVGNALSVLARRSRCSWRPASPAASRTGPSSGSAPWSPRRWWRRIAGPVRWPA